VKRRLLALPLAVFLMALSAPGSAIPSSGDRLVTDDDHAGAYRRYDGGTDQTMARCSTGRRQQNEPTIAVDPANTNIVVAGANDYCAASVNGEVWTGYYRSTNAGQTWALSLLPGYPNDSSPAGLASPLHGKCAAAGDPTQSFDTSGRLYYGFICFNRSGPVNGGVYVARYLNHGATYDRTVLVKDGTPSGLFLTGLFQDKINLTVDQTSVPSTSGNVYVAWSQYDGFAPNNAVLFSRSTDHGLSFSRPVKVTPKEPGTGSFADLAVGPNGAVYLTYLTYPSSSRPTWDIWLLKSTNGGVSWTAPAHVDTIQSFDSDQFSGNGFVDCGDGPFACPSGFTYSRFFSSSAVAADATGVHVVYAAEVDGQAKIFIRNSPNGVSWPTAPTTIDAVSRGHQWFPDIASAGGILTVIFNDSREDGAYSPDRPPGNTADGVNSGDVVNAFIARSSDGGTSWTETKVSSHGSNYGWETHGSRRVGFWGDYNYVSSVPGAVWVTWTDSRDLVPGDDPREFGEFDDMDRFDVFQPCTYVPNDINAPSYTSPTIGDTCLDQGGLDQNIYAARL